MNATVNTMSPAGTRAIETFIAVDSSPVRSARATPMMTTMIVMSGGNVS